VRTVLLSVIVARGGVGDDGRMRVPIVVATVAAAVFALEVRTADACSLFASEELVLDPSHADDVTPPLGVANVMADVYRGDGTCEGAGIIGFSFTVSDDRTPLDRLGYEVRPISGFDDSFGLRAGVWRFPLMPAEYNLHFGEHGQDVDVVFDIITVDLNGNRSAPVRVEIQDPAPDSFAGGCSAAGGGDPSRAGALALLLVTALVAIRGRSGPGRRGARAHRA
jgi:hypothetical protein